jgi:alpha-1,2-mannosyltransferase
MNILGLEIENDTCDGTSNRHISILLILLLGFTAANYLYNGVFRPLFTEKIDFEAYYNGALAFRYKVPIYQTMVDFFNLGPGRYEGPLPFVYPPCLAIFLSPLAYLSFDTAAFVWLSINQCLFFSGVYLLFRTISRKYSPVEAVVMIFVFMNFTPMFVDYLVGQCNGILFFFIAAGLYCYRSNKPIYAGVAIALACAMKVIPMLLLVYALWKRQFKVFLAGSLTLGLIFGYCLLFFDIRLLTWYIKFMMNQTLLNAFHDNHSLTGFFSRLLTHSIWVKGIFDSPTAASMCIILSSLLVLGVFLFSTRKKTQAKDPATLREYALAVITMLLLSKMATTLYLVMLLLPLGIMVKDMMDHAMSGKWLFFLIPAYAILAFWYPLPAGKFLKMDNYSVLLEGFPTILLSIQFIAVVILWCYFAFGGKPRSPRLEGVA